MTSLIAKLWTKISNKRAPISIMIVGLDNSGKTSILNCLAHNQLNSLHLNRQRTPSPELSNQDGSVQESNVDRFNTNIMPTAGYNYERIQFRNITMTVLDFSGQNRYRNLWQEFYNSVDGIVFVIDSSDIIRFVVARDELETMLSHPYFSTLQDEQLNRLNMISGATSSAMVQKQLVISQGKLHQNPLEEWPSSTTSSSTTKSNSKPTPEGQNFRKPHSRRRTKIPILFLANKTDLANSVETEVIIRALNLNQLPRDRHPWFVQATTVNSTQSVMEGFDWIVKELELAIN